MAERTNDERAERAAAALQAYKDLLGEAGPLGEDDISDLLADLHHYMMKYHAREGKLGADYINVELNFRSLHETAVMNFEAEVEEELK